MGHDAGRTGRLPPPAGLPLVGQPILGASFTEGDGVEFVLRPSNAAIHRAARGCGGRSQ
jgi:hypothetical protein